MHSCTWFFDFKPLLIQVSSNGYFAFEKDVRNPNPSSFLTETYLVSPFWADATLPPSEGAISYEIHTARNGSSELLARVSNHIREEMNDESFHGYWMMVAEWKGLRPAPGTISQVSLLWDLHTPNEHYGHAISYIIWQYKSGRNNMTDAALTLCEPMTTYHTHHESLVVFH